MRIVQGERIGKLGALSLACAAVIFDATRRKVLLTRRADDGRWCLPGGRMEAGESAAEACLREVWEETGLRVRINRLVGVYSDPHRLLEYPDGNRYHVVALCFEAAVVDGALRSSDETTAFGYFAPAEIEAMDLHEHHRERIADALLAQPTAFIR